MSRILTAVMFFGALGAIIEEYIYGEREMSEITFDLGGNIFETAKKSGAPKYFTENVAGFVSYGINSIPPDIPVRFQRNGYEISAVPLFAFTMYADESRNNGLAVQTASLQFSRHAAKIHASAQKITSDLIAQFQRGQWKRYISEQCPSVSGRSTFLNEAGEVTGNGTCPLDPQYALLSEDWIKLMRMTQNYQWSGDGVLATLTIGYSDDVRGVTYAINLEFDDIAIKTSRDFANLSRDLAEGDAQGWNSSAKYQEAMSARKVRIKILEEFARKRGDTILPR